MDELVKQANGVWYHKGEKRLANRDVLQFLYSDAYSNSKSFSRCCLHNDINSKLMVMIIAFVEFHAYPAHRHDWKDESYLIIDGSCEYIEYTPSGQIAMTQYLTVGDIYYNSGRSFHQLNPCSERLGLIECTTGPISNQCLEYL